MMPKRIQRKRTKGWELPTNAVVVTRPSEFGNPFKIYPVTHEKTGAKEWWIDAIGGGSTWMFKTKAEAQEATVKLFDHWVKHNAPMNYTDRAKLALKGRDVCCWCGLDEPCHGDILLRLANP